MDGAFDRLWVVVAAVGAIVVAVILIRQLLGRLGVPALVGYLLLGLGLSAANREYALFQGDALHVFEFLGGIGVFCLLFRVGLESNVDKLLAQLGRAVWIWVGNVGVSALLGYAVTRYLLGYALVPSLFVAVALTATSLAVSLAIWRDLGALGTPTGDLLIDVAELDDVSGIALMMILFALAPVLVRGDGVAWSSIGETAGWLMLKASMFFVFCVVFARYFEAPITRFFAGLRPSPDPMLLMVGIAVVIAAAADGLGFSLPVGALFAGLVFSRDPQVIKVDASFSSLYDLFTPFFFIWIGLSIDTGALGGGLYASLAILAAAVLGKVVGTVGPAWPLVGSSAALALGVSMVPRAEIAMVIVAEGRRLGAWAMPEELYGAMILMAAATCVVAPLLAAALLRRAGLAGAGTAGDAPAKADRPEGR
jgi:Kef-type K+ transport system membrane component KefB